MNNKVDISILGCGWLGFPLAKKLISEGYNIKGSTTSLSKLDTLSALGVCSYLLHFKTVSTSENLPEFLDSDILIITVPPGRNNGELNENYRQMVKQLINYLPKSAIKKIIFISSTAVYEDVNTEVNEDNGRISDTDSARLLVHAEQELMQVKNIKTVVLRLSGLIGPGRHPARFFAGKTNIPNGLAPINLIHLEDVISVIIKLVESADVTGIYNASAPSHPSRQEFYTLAAKQARLGAPDFLPEKRNWKMIDSTRITTELAFKFKVDNLMEWLSSDQTNI